MSFCLSVYIYTLKCVCCKARGCLLGQWTSRSVWTLELFMNAVWVSTPPFCFVFFVWIRTKLTAFTRSPDLAGINRLRDVFLEACLHHVASAFLHDTGGYGQLTVNNYISSRHPPPFLFSPCLLVFILFYFRFF